MSASSDSVSGASVVSAPSVTTTSAESGSPASSSRARVSASPTRVSVPSNVRSAGLASRSVDEENLKKRSANRSASAWSSGASGPPSACWTKALRGLAVAVGNPHAARVVDQDADEVLLRHGGAQDQHRPEEAEEQHRQRGEAQADEHEPVAQAAFERDRAVGDDRDHHDDAVSTSAV